MISVDISYEQESFQLQAPESQVTVIIQKTCEQLGTVFGEVSCTFVSDETMRELNRTYRDKDEPTDILSFVQDDEDDGFPSYDEQEKSWGDMVISLAAMERNCTDFAVSAHEELIRLLVHGILHLHGYDHESTDASEPMLQKQEEFVTMWMKETVQ
jgi:probable rRNA maturation factor